MLRLGAIIASFLLLLTCCTGRTTDGRLVRIAAEVAVSPNEALAALDSIDPRSLPDADRHFYDFLTIKARDKAYITHESDSLILDLVKYYSTNSNDTVYPEALYYAGRVYSDLGDYPTALDYFQKALNHIDGSEQERTDLKGCVLSQTARLLNSLRLYSQAVPYLTKALAIDSVKCDTFNLTYDNELLGAIYLHQGDGTTAKKYFRQASRWASYLKPRDMAHMQMYMAATKLLQKDIDSALILIRVVPSNVRPIHQNLAYAYASDIYLAAGFKDSAYFYADKLIHSSRKNNRKNGYRNLFSDKLFNLIPTDSLPVFTKDYFLTMEAYYNSHENEHAILQNTFYNYRIHQRERQNAERRAIEFSYYIGILILIVLVSVIVILFLKYRKKKLLAELQSTILQLEDLQHSLASSATTTEPAPINHVETKSVSELDTLKARLNDQISKLEKHIINKAPVSSVLLNSDILKKINKFILDGKTIADSSPLWNELEQTVLGASPHFKEHLQLLIGQNLKTPDYNLVLLIRCGISPAQLAILLGRTKSTISYRRKHLCEMVLGREIDGKFFDDIIRCI